MMQSFIGLVGLIFKKMPKTDDQILLQSKSQIDVVMLRIRCLSHVHAIFAITIVLS